MSRNAFTCSRRAWSSAEANRSQNRCPPRAISIVFHAFSLDRARASVNFSLWSVKWLRTFSASLLDPVAGELAGGLLGDVSQDPAPSLTTTSATLPMTWGSKTCRTASVEVFL